MTTYDNSQLTHESEPYTTIIICHVIDILFTISMQNWVMSQEEWMGHYQQGKSEGFDSGDQPSSTQIGFKSLIFQPVWPWNLMDDLKTV